MAIYIGTVMTGDTGAMRDDSNNSRACANVAPNKGVFTETC
jgi:hypothetical protein